MKVLAVDDDIEIRELLPLILAAAEVDEVKMASSAESALSAIMAENEPFQCFFLDIQMPVKSGVDLCRDIRALPAYQHVPIIMLTAMRERSYIDEAFAAGATDYATKPFEIEDICARVRLAKLLVEEQNHAKEPASELGEPSDTLEEISDAVFNEPRDFRGINGVVSKEAFERYLVQLSPLGVPYSSFFAVHIQNAWNIAEHCTLAAFEITLCNVAKAIVSAQRAAAVVACHVGGGSFVCSTRAPIMLLAEQIERDIQNMIHKRNLVSDYGSPLVITVEIGPRTRPLAGEPLGLHNFEEPTLKRA